MEDSIAEIEQLQLNYHARAVELRTADDDQQARDRAAWKAQQERQQGQQEEPEEQQQVEQPDDGGEAYYRRVARRQLNAREAADGTLTIHLDHEDMPTAKERSSFMFSRPPKGKIAKGLREKRRIVVGPGTRRVVVVAPDGTVVLRWAVNALSGVALAQVHRLALLDNGDGGDLKRQLACAGRPDVQRLKNALRHREVRLAYGIGDAEVVEVKAGKCFYRKQGSESISSFHLSGSLVRRRDHGGLDKLELLNFLELSDEVDALSRVELEAMGVALPPSSRIFSELYSVLLDDGASVLHGHIDARDAIPNALVRVNPRGASKPTTGGELFLHDGVILLDYGDRDVVFLRGSDYFHSVLRLGAPQGHSQAGVCRYSLVFARHKPSHKKANYVDVPADAPAPREAADARLDNEIAAARAAAPEGPLTRKRRRTAAESA